jgi:hypothetical protein
LNKNFVYCKVLPLFTLLLCAKPQVGFGCESGVGKEKYSVPAPVPSAVPAPAWKNYAAPNRCITFVRALLYRYHVKFYFFSSNSTSQSNAESK